MARQNPRWLAGVFSLRAGCSLINILQMDVKTLIIGAGPAGMAAAIQLTHLEEEFIILERTETGGLLLNANRVENYPGTSDSPSGGELVERFKRQMEALGIKVVRDAVVAADLKNNETFAVRTQNSIYESKNLIVASGTEPIALKIEADQQILYELRPIRNVEGKYIIIIGGGDAAFDYALTLSKRNRVVIVYRSARPRCHKRLYQEVSRSPKIRLIPNTPIDGWDELRKADYILAAIGRRPAIDFLCGRLKECIPHHRGIQGLFFAGDVARGDIRQAAIAAGDGILAALGVKT